MVPLKLGANYRLIIVSIISTQTIEILSNSKVKRQFKFSFSKRMISFKVKEPLIQINPHCPFNTSLVPCMFLAVRYRPIVIVIKFTLIKPSFPMIKYGSKCAFRGFFF